MTTATARAPDVPNSSDVSWGGRRFVVGRFVLDEADVARRDGADVLTVPSQVLRFGPLPYLDANNEIRWELKHPEDFASDEFLASVNGRPVVDGHPAMIGDHNLHQYARGVCHDRVEVLDEGVKAWVSIYGDDLIEKVLDGKTEVSTGIWNGLVREEGVYDGLPYQFRQVRPRLNHLGVVDKGRCGEACRLHVDDGNDAHVVPDLSSVESAVEALDTSPAVDAVSPAEIGRRFQAEASREGDRVSGLFKPPGSYNRTDADRAVRALALRATADSFAGEGGADVLRRWGFDLDGERGGNVGKTIDEVLGEISERVTREDVEVLGIHQRDPDQPIQDILANVVEPQKFDAHSFHLVELDPETVNVEGVELFQPMLEGVQAIVGDLKEDAEVEDPVTLQVESTVPGEGNAERVVQAFVFEPLDGWDVDAARQWITTKFREDAIVLDGIVPPNPQNFSTDEESSWSEPRPETNLADMTPQQKRQWMRLYAWARTTNTDEITNLSDDLKGPHHFPDGTLSFRGLVALTARRNQMDIPNADMPPVERHIADHYRDFDRVAPWEREDASLDEGETIVLREMGYLSEDGQPPDELFRSYRKDRMEYYKRRDGEELASFLNERIDAQVIGDRSRSDIIADMADSAGIAPSTVNSILSEGIDCPPRRRLEGFAEALGVAVSDVVAAAERDGCEYETGDIGDMGRPLDSFKGRGRSDQMDQLARLKAGDAELDFSKLVELRDELPEDKRGILDGLTTDAAEFQKALDRLGGANGSDPAASGNTDGGDGTATGDETPETLRSQLDQIKSEVEQRERERRDVQSKLDRTRERLNQLAGGDQGEASTDEELLQAILEKHADDYGARDEQLKAELDEKKSEIERIQGQLEAVTDEKTYLQNKVEHLEQSALTQDDLTRHMQVMNEIKAIFPRWDWNGESEREMKVLVVQQSEDMVDKPEDQRIDPEAVSDERLDERYRAVMDFLKGAADQARDNGGNGSTPRADGRSVGDRSLAPPDRSATGDESDEIQQRIDEKKKARRRMWVGLDEKEDT